jgi:hypothetical protein
MTKYSKFNVIYRLQKWLDSVPGQTFMNYAYSWGASIVILGALFKLTHLPGANFWLFLGMGTEVFVFFIAGFDRPFDKTEDGKDLPTHVNLDDINTEGTEVTEGSEGTEGAGVTIVGGGGSGTIIIGGGGASGEGVIGGGEGVVGGGGGIIGGGGFIGGGGYVGGGAGSAGVSPADGADEAGTYTEGGTAPAGTGIVGGGGFIGGVVAPQQPELPEIDPEEMEEATVSYVEQLKALTETLK